MKSSRDCIPSAVHDLVKLYDAVFDRFRSHLRQWTQKGELSMLRSADLPEHGPISRVRVSHDERKSRRFCVLNGNMRLLTPYAGILFLVVGLNSSCTRRDVSAKMIDDQNVVTVGTVPAVTIVRSAGSRRPTPRSITSSPIRCMLVKAVAAGVLQQARRAVADIETVNAGSPRHLLQQLRHIWIDGKSAQSQQILSQDLPGCGLISENPVARAVGENGCFLRRLLIGPY